MMTNQQLESVPSLEQKRSSKRCGLVVRVNIIEPELATLQELVHK